MVLSYEGGPGHGGQKGGGCSAEVQLLDWPALGLGTAGLRLNSVGFVGHDESSLGPVMSFSGPCWVDLKSNFDDFSSLSLGRIH